jgi:hypothetical protein
MEFSKLINSLFNYLVSQQTSAEAALVYYYGTPSLFFSFSFFEVQILQKICQKKFFLGKIHYSSVYIVCWVGTN